MQAGSLRYFQQVDTNNRSDKKEEVSTKGLHQWMNPTKGRFD